MASCVVDVLSPGDAPVLASRYINRCYAYRPLIALSSLRAAITACEPDLIVPCDDRAVMHLLQLHKILRAAEGEKCPIVSLIERSLGTPENYTGMMSRSGCIATAHKIGVRAPETFPVASEKDLADCLTTIGLPAVLKVDGTWGGDGVTVVRSRKEARSAFRRLANPPSRLRSLVRAVRRRDTHHLMAAIALPPQLVSVQRFISGYPAASAFACWEGEIVGAIYYDVLVAQGTIGPPNVIKRVDCVEMEEATHRIARRFGLSGLHGIDFIRDATGAAHLIEVNPRATQGGTLPFGKGRDLPAALAACITRSEVVARPSITNDIVVLFPREWQRDPVSPYLRSGHHDVPWDDPDVLLASFVSQSRARAPDKKPRRVAARHGRAKMSPHVTLD
jgi:glutathione synthase/RimK-type ligase-like ATP-grasp enzyme